jgi:hypothetical protein
LCGPVSHSAVAATPVRRSMAASAPHQNGSPGGGRGPGPSRQNRRRRAGCRRARPAVHPSVAGVSCGAGR